METVMGEVGQALGTGIARIALAEPAHVDAAIGRLDAFARCPRAGRGIAFRLCFA
jgi:hypothetical protein